MDDLEDNVDLARNLLFWVVVVTLIVIGLSFVHFWLRPVALGYEREAFVESHQYVEARKTEILGMISQYDELEAEIAKYEDSGNHSRIVNGLRAQQRSLANKIRAALAKIPCDSWPEGAERFEK